jgi:acyl-CoA synthetase (NDP forming)
LAARSSPTWWAILVYSLPESAASALAAAASYSEYGSRVEGTSLPVGAAVAVAQARILSRTGGGDSLEGRWLAPQETSALLDACGIRCLPSVQAKDAEAATRAASALGYPVALKIVSRAVQHKSDVGGVLLNLKDKVALRDGVASLERNTTAAGHRADLDGFLVQPMAPRGIRSPRRRRVREGYASPSSFRTSGTE